MKLLAYNSRFNVFPFRENKYQVTNKREDNRYSTGYERIGVFNTLLEAIHYIQVFSSKERGL